MAQAEQKAVYIRHRPDQINDRGEFGHWEDDLMIFRPEHGNANIARWWSAKAVTPCCFATMIGNRSRSWAV